MMKTAAAVLRQEMREKHKVILDGLDDDIVEYLLNMDTDIMTDSEVDEVIVAYFPALDNECFLQSFKAALLKCKTTDAGEEIVPSLNPTPISIVAESETASSPTCTQSVQESDDVEELHAMLPQLELHLIRFVYEVRSGCCKVEAGRFLIENSLDRINQLYEAHKIRLLEKEKEEQREKRKLKSAIFEKYGTEEVRPKYDEKGNPTKTVKPVVFIDAKKQSIRYRDGQVVTYKGEKVIIEHNPADDYDGGSRGKVKTKGKRGPGWV